MLKKIAFSFIALLLFTGCYKNHLYVQVEKVDKDFLASANVGTPDYRLDDPPFGQRINISWWFPKNLYSQELTLYLTVRFWDNTQETKVFNVDKRVGSDSFYFPNKEIDKNHKIITYRIEVFNSKNDIIEIWKHHFWTDLINVDIDD